VVRQRVLIVAALILVLTLHPWTWPAHGTSGLLIPSLVYAIVVVVVCLCAIKLGDLPSPFHRPPRGPRPPKLRVARQKPPVRTAEDVTRAAEQLLRPPPRPRP
jgi:hypothetical protein